MDTRILIACAGTQDKWKNYRGTRSHLVPDKTGEPILHRTVRLILESSKEYPPEMTVVCPAGTWEEYQVHGVPALSGTEGAWNEFISSRPYWSTYSRNILVLGDTFFTENAIQVILNDKSRGFRVFGRSHPSPLTGSPWGEIFAYSWWPNFNTPLDNHLDRVYKANKAGNIRRRCGWEVLYSIQGADITKKQPNGLCPHVVLSKYFVEINDLTDDIDFPIDWHKHPRFGKS